ncbi:hypothetical protein AAFF_G00173540 [Aldrovandia affinis]|uniref:Uncharacterized protein n=1 Tax=Aldrovandia affinis TaxID=143900 RepID=A0AAD7SZQ2_9TELE|nr:hypothetical protein AAFF_G00173540 [Aldrovandia affinis]
MLIHLEFFPFLLTGDKDVSNGGEESGGHCAWPDDLGIGSKLKAHSLPVPLFITARARASDATRTLSLSPRGRPLHARRDPWSEEDEERRREQSDASPCSQEPYIFRQPFVPADKSRVISEALKLFSIRINVGSRVKR